jgi:hypothetical protein
MLCQLRDVKNFTIHNCYDKKEIVYWQRKGSVTTTGPAAYLLRLQYLHQQHYSYAPLRDYIPGGVNLMVNVTTRPWELNDSDLYALTSTLLTRRSDPELLFNVPRPRTNIGNDGTSFTLTTASIRSSDAGTTLSQSSKSLDNGKDTNALLPATMPSELEQWRMHFVQSVRRSPGRGPLTSEKISMATSIYASKGKSEPISVMIPRPSKLNPSPSLSSSSCWPKPTASQDMMILKH